MSLVEVLAAHVHDLWAEKRLAEGWVHGIERDDGLRTHPCLVPFAELPGIEADYDRQIVVGLVKAIVALGFRIRPGEPASG
jgi:hypothetical protein